MSQRIRITVTAELCSVLDCGENSVSQEDFAAAGLSNDEMEDAMCRTIGTQAERARYNHKPRREATPTTGADYSTTDAPD